MIKSPFNFVPLNNNVIFPYWADQISQDIPFSDGVSGIIKLTITADSPIYIRNGQLHKDENSKDKDYSFSHVSTSKGNRYFIPGTSIKGEARNILEIMSYGKMSVDERAQFARRDLRNKDVYPLLGNQKKEHCGWLRRNGENYEIEDCGRFWRISHPEIDRLLGAPVMRKHFSKITAGTLKDEQKTATYKYGLVEDESVLENRSFKKIGENQMQDTLVDYSPNGSLHGTIVFTGQPSSWTEPRNKQAKGKYYEFVFPEEKQAVRKISREDFDHYVFIYKASEEWKRINRLLEESENGGRGVPVFFIPKGADSVEHFGMAYLYKMPYNHSVFESLPKDHQNKDKHDLAECIFGYTNKEDSLKGRVQFGHAFASEAKPLERIRLVLGSPKASYYPLYVNQDGKNGITSDYKTYDDGTPSGWKRYYVRQDTNSAKPTGQDKVDTFMEPLDKGATFQGTVTFHNLRPVELGALLSALTFHATPECRHQLGMAKAYGFGRCRYNINMKITASAGKPQSEEYYMARYEHFMSQQLATDWIRQSQLTELFTMAGNDVSDNGVFDFMIMSNNHTDNEFESAKKAHEYLQRATAFLHTITPKTLCNTPEFQSELKAIKKQEEEKQAEIARLRRQKELENFKKEMEQKIVNAGADKTRLYALIAELDETASNGQEEFDIVKSLKEKIDVILNQIKLQEVCNFKKRYEQLIAQADKDKNILNILRTELSNNHSDDKDKQNAVNQLVADIDKRLEQIKQTPKGFQDAFITEVKDYKQFHTRVEAGLRNLRKSGVDKMSEEDIAFGEIKLQEAYDHDDKKSPKNWAATTGSYYKKCVKTVGEDIANKWFTKLKR